MGVKMGINGFGRIGRFIQVDINLVINYGHIFSALGDKRDKAVSNKVFIIHGRNMTKRNELKRFLEDLRLEPVILDERPNRGRTITEKLEDTLHSVDYAVAIFTADDVGKLAFSDSDLEKRSRQNVLFELGQVYRILGRNKICILRENDLKLPSDLDGVLYIRLDEKDSWKRSLVKELEGAGLKIDLAKALKT